MLERMRIIVLLTVVGFMATELASAAEKHPLAAPGVTSLTNASVKYRMLKEAQVILKRGEVTAVIVNNEAVDLPEVPGHRARHNGVASLTHTKQGRNLFVPSYAGLNFEHIHDGTTKNLKNKFEPREFPMQLRRIDDHTVEVYQAPTGHWELESCGRYQLLQDGTIEYTFECIPRALAYERDFIGLFWASYLDKPEKKSIHFIGRTVTDKKSRWIEGITPAHGTESTHPPASLAAPFPKIDEDFPLTLVNHPSRYRYLVPFYYGVSRGMAFVQIFRERDGIWFAQSPSGGGQGNPAWDFQWFIRKPKVNEAYGFVMRAAYMPFAGREKLVEAVSGHVRALNPQG